MGENMIALVLIATGGERYTQYAEPFLESAEKYFPAHTSFVFTDSKIQKAINLPYPDLGWPRATLMRYHAIWSYRDYFKKFSHIFYADIDMLMTAKIEPEEILTDGLTAVIHPGFPDAFCRNPESTAYVPPSWHPTYYQGCFQGGDTESFLNMSATLSTCIDLDDQKGVVAIWHDESHFNRYLINRPPAKVLTPAYAYPSEHYLRNKESWWTPETIIKIKHLEKLNQGSWKNK
jgi:histo-blood group ABO system transferase